MNLDNRMLAGARTGPFATSERELAADLWRQVPDHSITLIDRGLSSVRTRRATPGIPGAASGGGAS